jgi:hypothetical protein
MRPGIRTDTAMTVTTTALLFLAVAGLIAALAVPLRRGSVRPNWWYGFRTRSTVHDPRLWYPVNQFAARQLLGATAVQAATNAVVLVWLRDRLSVEQVAVIGTVVFLATTTFAVARSFAYLARQKVEQSASR